mmetsp:Transcript_3819/g.3565  ORF Transcript_3819/g.3565 Transcript_3819/m.3565 type:complete len:98 (-) Transcript_3819:662-955(-)
MKEDDYNHRGIGNLKKNEFCIDYQRDKLFSPKLVKRRLNTSLYPQKSRRKSYVGISETEIHEFLIPISKMNVKPEPCLQLPNGKFIGKFNLNSPVCK